MFADHNAVTERSTASLETPDRPSVPRDVHATFLSRMAERRFVSGGSRFTIRHRWKRSRKHRALPMRRSQPFLAATSGQHRVLFTLAAETGRRAGELYGLRVEDIDFVRNVVTVDGAYGKVWPKLQRPKKLIPHVSRSQTARREQYREA